MAPSFPSDVTMLLKRAESGDPEARAKLMPLIYDELHRLAHAQRRRGKPYETLNTTALVHEAYIKLAAGDSHSWQDRNHFFAVAARVIHSVAVDYARRQQAAKRSGDLPDVTLDEALMLPDVQADEILALHEALERLEAFDEREARIVELRYFVGLTIEETADVLEISSATVRRDWIAARAWLFRKMNSDINGAR